MLSLVPITLAAFALLALLIILLLRTTSLRLWQGVLLFLLPLMVANLLWFSWLHPRQERQALAAEVSTQLSLAPGYRLLKIQEPALWQLLNRELLHKRLEGMPADQALGDMRGWLMDLINQRLTRATDEAILNYVRVSVQEMQALQQQEPQRCFRFLYPQVNGGINLQQVLSPELNQRDAQALEALLQQSTGNEQPLDHAVAQRDLQSVVEKLYGKWGDRLQQLNMPADTAVDRGAMCAMSIDLYNGILALPDKQAANLLRKMVSLTG
ncbi:hypothetical protein HS962_03520 [Pantoea sp. BIGb0393]|uniref:Uncharacterized protein n=1 Tax=Pantoea nemavictus TaxID=2726955 RepID=A0ABU8PNI9_9GAMM|nr:hypothetical protein [Pantoea nemavictus]MBA0035315.1 hypothetical protein [Pantoea nemavictus]